MNQSTRRLRWTRKVLSALWVDVLYLREESERAASDLESVDWSWTLNALLFFCTRARVNGEPVRLFASTPQRWIRFARPSPFVPDWYLISQTPSLRVLAP
jgi:hypothetical protein